MRRWIVRLLVILGIVAAGLALRATVFAPKPLEVTVTEVSRGRVEQTVTNSRAGTVKARHRAQISPEIGGRVVEVPFREGDPFRKGDVLLRLNPSVSAARIDLSRRELQAAEAQWHFHLRRPVLLVVHLEALHPRHELRHLGGVVDDSPYLLARSGELFRPRDDHFDTTETFPRVASGSWSIDQTRCGGLQLV